MQKESEKLGFKNFDFLINQNCIKDLYFDSFKMLISIILFFIFLYAILISKNNVFYFNGFELSKTYLLPFFITLYMSVYSIYRLFFIRYGRTIINISFNNDQVYFKLIYGIKVFSKREYKVVLDPNKLNYANKGEFGGRPYKKYEFHYIGIEINKSIYLIPYAENKKDILLSYLVK